MKKVFVLFAISIAPYVFAQTQTDTISVKGMSCGMCERRIEKNVGKMAGVTTIEADVEREIAVLSYDPAKTSKDAIEQAISRLGYTAGSYEADKVARENLPGCCNPKAHH